MAMRVQASSAALTINDGGEGRRALRLLPSSLLSPPPRQIKSSSSSSSSSALLYSSPFNISSMSKSNLRHAAPAIFSKPSFASSSTAVHASRRRFSSPDKSPEFASPEDLSFESPLKIVEYPDPLLRARNKRIKTFDDALKKLVDEMFDIMYKTDGMGLSAPQVGINVQLMVFNAAGKRGEGEEIVLVNPVVYKSSKKTILFKEGCLSFPGIYANVERPTSVKIDARDLTGGRFKVNLSGLPARVFQHEFDHLQGTLFFDRMSSDELESIRSELKALEKKYEERTGHPTPERVDDYEGVKVVAGFAGS